MTDAPLTLVTGATGKTGRRVLDRLVRQGRRVRAGSRSAAIPFDWTEPRTWPAALEGVDQAYLAFQPDLAAPGVLEIVEGFTRLAVDSGVRRLVLLSGRGEAAARAAERVVEDSGAAWTTVRAAWFTQNFTEGHFREPLLAGTLALPAPATVGEPFVDVDDIADVAAEALTTESHDGRCYEVTGPELLTLPEAVDELGAALGRELRYLEVPPAAFREEMVRAGGPPELAAFLAELMRTVLDGRNESVADGVERALGRPARSFRETLRAAASSGAWAAA